MVYEAYSDPGRCPSNCAGVLELLSGACCVGAVGPSTEGEAFSSVVLVWSMLTTTGSDRTSQMLAQFGPESHRGRAMSKKEDAASSPETSAKTKAQEPEIQISIGRKLLYEAQYILRRFAFLITSTVLI
jgi:hypothetical protein